MRERTCERCGHTFRFRHGSPRLCSPCYHASRRDQHGGQYVGVSPGTVGAIHELIVSADLMRRGYHVFRALSQSSPCDLIAFRESGVLLRIEVKTTVRYASGEIRVLTFLPGEKEKFDVLALVTHDGGLMYVPEIRDVQETS